MNEEEIEPLDTIDPAIFGETEFGDGDHYVLSEEELETPCE